MKSLTLKMLVLMLAVFVFLSGCSRPQGKPGIEVLHELATKSFREMVYTTDMSRLGMIETPKHGPQNIKKIDILNPQFLSDPVIIEVVKKKDINGVERNMWVVEINAKAKVEYILDFVNTEEPYSRTESVKYKMFLYKNSNGGYVFENGVIESFQTS